MKTLFLAAMFLVHFQNVDNEWAKHLHNKSGVNCCSAADATWKDPDWGIADGRYWVFIDGERRYVHPSAVIESPNRTNSTLVWTVIINGQLQIKCFMPGFLT